MESCSKSPADQGYLLTRAPSLSMDEKPGPLGTCIAIFKVAVYYFDDRTNLLKYGLRLNEFREASTTLEALQDLRGFF